MLTENTASIWLQTCLKTSTCVVKWGLVKTWWDLPAILKQALQAHDPQLCPRNGKCPSRDAVDSLNYWATKTGAVQAIKTLWWSVILERLLRTESSNPRLEEETSVGSRLVWYWDFIYFPTWTNHKRSNRGEWKEQNNSNRVFSQWTQGFLGGEHSAFCGKLAERTAARRQVPTDNEQRLQETRNSLVLGMLVLFQFKGSILPSSMAPSGEDLVRLLVLISMGRHGHWALSHIVPCMENGSSAVWSYNAFILLIPASS